MGSVDPDACAAELRAIAERNGLHAIGFASAEPFEATRVVLEQRKADGLHGGMQFTYRNPARSTEPDRVVPDVATLVVAARAYPSEQAEHLTSRQGRVARYATGDHYGALRGGLEALAQHLRSQGWTARVVLDDNALVDRAAAERAGLGWFGKNANLLLPGLGSYFVLGSVLTDARLPVDDDRVPDGCGTCTRCIDGCPTGAIVAPGVLDARRCLAWLLQAEGDFPLEHREALGDRIYGCDECQEVCPPNRRVDRGAVGQEGQRDARAAVTDDRVDVVAMLEIDDDELLARHGSWYIARRDPRYLRRNALVVLGNVGDPNDDDAVRVIDSYRLSDDPMLAEHARWAADRIGIGATAPAAARGRA